LKHDTVTKSGTFSTEFESLLREKDANCARIKCRSNACVLALLNDKNCYPRYLVTYTMDADGPISPTNDAAVQTALE